jgi:hypothetical protein
MKACKCMKIFTSWKYLAPIPREDGQWHHLWQCQLCGRQHCTFDKKKPDESQHKRVRN